MKNYRKITKIMLIVIGLGLAIYDFLPFGTSVRGDTISEVIAYYALRSFTLPLVFGVLGGHFFFTRDNGNQYPKILITFAIIFIILDIITHIFNISVLMTIQAYPIIMLISGVPIGSYLWSQSKKDKLK